MKATRSLAACTALLALAAAAFYPAWPPAPEARTCVAAHDGAEPCATRAG